MEKVVVRESPIHGRGVFATRRIEAGEVVIEGCREVLTYDALEALAVSERKFLARLDGQTVLMTPPSRFVNHSCRPNAQGTRWHDVAVRVIEAGEEVTVDYGDEHASGRRVECRCGAPDCRGWFADSA